MKQNHGAMFAILNRNTKRVEPPIDFDDGNVVWMNWKRILAALSGKRRQLLQRRTLCTKSSFREWTWTSTSQNRTCNRRKIRGGNWENGTSQTEDWIFLSGENWCNEFSRVVLFLRCVQGESLPDQVGCLVGHQLPVWLYRWSKLSLLWLRIWVLKLVSNQTPFDCS